MTAYAAVVSLMNTMNQIQNHPRLSTSLDRNQIECLGQKLDVIMDFLENYNSHGGTSKDQIEYLERQIAYAAYAAEDVIESHLADQILAGSSKEGSISLLDLKKEIEELDSVMVRVKEVKEELRFKEEQLVHSRPANLSRPLTSGETRMVGFDGYLCELMDLVTRPQLGLQIIPIVGMGGIGKTTLARNVYDSMLIVHHFDIRFWVNVSQEYDLKQIFLGILGRSGELDERPIHELGERLHLMLFGRRYLIVLDDMWSIEVWDNIKIFFPDSDTGSRIVVTTRLLSLANQFGSSSLVMNFLDDEQSWSLFCSKAFAQEGCPPELEIVGKTIVRQCRGLPLSIVVVAGFLQNSPMKLEYWEFVAENMSSVLNSVDDDHLMRILSLSYSHLPTHLKPCFLYMGVFPEDREIRVSRVIKLWVAEGFIKPKSYQLLEVVAEDYLRDLIDRNLILACSLGSNGRLKTCKMHDLLRNLCIRVAMKEEFLCVRRLKTVFDTPRDKNWERRIIIQGSPAETPQLLHTLKSAPLVRTLICDSPAIISFESRLFRVLIEVYGDSLDATFQQVNLRFLACESICAPIGWISTYELPSSISLLWNVQTFIIDGSIDKVVAPSEIWEMPQLRHIQFHRVSLPDPPLVDNQDNCVLHNLQTLRTVLDFKCSEEVCRRMPNIKKLRIFYDDFSGEGEKSLQYGLYNVENFQRLESLYCCFYAVPDRDDLLPNLKFPHSLKKLILEDCELHWSDLSIIGSLPLLQVLKLKHQSVRGSEWNPVEGDFLRLKFLEIDSCYLIHWNADYFSFPCLEKVVLSNLYKLNEIPLDMGEIFTFRNICVVDCSISAAISAVEILEEQLSVGNVDLHVRVSFSEKMKLEEFKDRVEPLSFLSSNLHIGGV